MQGEADRFTEERPVEHSPVTRNSKWAIDAITNLVNFAAITLEPAQPLEFPLHIVDFLTQPLFGFSYVGFLKYDKSASEWKVLSHVGETMVDISFIPTFEGNMMLEEEKEIYTFFSVLDESFLIFVTFEDQDNIFSEYEFSFFSLFSTLISSFYSMKRLAKDVEEKIVEMSTIKASTNIITGLKEGNVTIEEAFSELMASLSMDAVVLGSYDREADAIKISLSKGIDVTNWDDFLIRIFTTEEFFNEEWELFSLFDEHLVTYGAVACRMTKGNPTLYAIQKRVMEYTIPQITTILSQRKFHTESITDALTGVYNRRHALKILREKVRFARLDPSAKLSVAMLDIDHFKNVNDTYGHQSGDVVLYTAAAVIGGALRGTDVVGRYGGEEFLVIMHANEKGALHVCERIRKNVEASEIIAGEHKIKVTISIGTITFNSGFESAEQLIARADENLYKAKASGRNRVISGAEDEAEPDAEAVTGFEDIK